MDIIIVSIFNLITQRIFRYFDGLLLELWFISINFRLIDREVKHSVRLKSTA